MKKAILIFALFLIAFVSEVRAPGTGCTIANESFVTGNNLANYSTTGSIIENALQVNSGQFAQRVHKTTNLSTNTNNVTFIFGNYTTITYNGNFQKSIFFFQSNVTTPLEGWTLSIHIQRDGTNNQLLLGNEGANDEEIILSGNASAEVAITFFTDLNASVYVNGTYRASMKPYYWPGVNNWGNFSFYRIGRDFSDESNSVRISWVAEINGSYGQTCAAEAAPDTTPPEINANSYNMTSEGGAGCTNWRTNRSNPCSTSDVTPTVNFTTNEVAWCAIGTQDLNFSNYTRLAVNRNCTVGQGTTSHTCTLVSEDELVYDTSFIYLGCQDAANNSNLTSTSGALSLSITGLEVVGRTSIGIGIQNALLSAYTNYTDLPISARSLNNSLAVGTFDRAAEKSNKMWAFNRIGASESHVNMLNLSGVLYTLEFANKTSSNITLEVEKLVNATK